MDGTSSSRRIIDSAVELFCGYGFNATGVRDIADSAGVSVQTFYEYFDSKEAIAVIALREHDAALRLPDLIDSPLDPLSRLRRHFQTLRGDPLRRIPPRGGLIALFGIEVADHSEVIRGALSASLCQWTAAVAVAITQGQKSGQLDGELNPESVASFVVSAWQGAVIHTQIERSETAYRAFCEVVFGNVLSPKPATVTVNGSA